MLASIAVRARATAHTFFLVFVARRPPLLLRKSREPRSCRLATEPRFARTGLALRSSDSARNPQRAKMVPERMPEWVPRLVIAFNTLTSR
jgi:hypothetical protein